jgi:hypothetical protein
MKILKIATFVAMSVVALSVSAAEAKNIKWRDIIGVVDAGNIVGVGDLGFVSNPLFPTEGIPGGAPWSTLSGGVKVNLESGHVQFEVKGLVLAAGSAFTFRGLQIGTTGGINAVKGTLVCNVSGAGGTESVFVDAPTVPLSATGDAKFNGEFPSIPDECTTDPDPNNVAFLIRTSGGPFDGVWIASGAVLDR